MRLAVVGGGLQGIEAAYLAKKAGWEVCLVDRSPAVIAGGLCDRFIQCDVARPQDLDRRLTDIDLVLPALENESALRSLTAWARQSEIPLIFDQDAYAVSASKVESNRLFERLQLPTPSAWPNCRPPLMAKPAFGSGSRGVRLLGDTDRLRACFPGKQPPDGWVLQQYVPGPIHSLEVIGFRNRYRALYVTDLAMDASFDCKRVTAPSELSPELVRDLERMALSIADAIHLNGIMDIEAVCFGGTLKILEIDARLPSQTPITVYGASGLNMVEWLGRLFTERCDAIPLPPPAARATILEHVRFREGLLEIGGEHLMTCGGPLHLECDFFGADEAITDCAPGRSEWVATLIVTAADRPGAWRKRNRVIENMMTRLPVKRYLDLEPVSGSSGQQSSTLFCR
jgi:pyrrolysine biosynthesis protein PylC